MRRVSGGRERGGESKSQSSFVTLPPFISRILPKYFVLNPEKACTWVS
jgi:hypothetical protein